MNDQVLYSNLEKYTHPVIKTTIQIVRELEDKWHDNTSESINIKRLVEIILNEAHYGADAVKSERWNEVFQYFCASVIYAETISRSEASLTIAKFGISYDFLVKRITLAHLDKIARDILNKMVEYTFLEGTSSPEEMQQNFVGALATLKSDGSIPFMKVYTKGNIDVSIRLGFELIEDSKNTRAKRILDINEPLKAYPIKSYQNGEHQRIMHENGTLKDIIHDDDFRKRILKGKYVTWIHKTLNEFDYDRVSYEIEIINESIKSNARNSYIDPNLLERFAGRPKVKWNNSNRGKFSQEDIIVTFFNDMLFKNASGTSSLQDLEYWTQDLIKESVSLQSESTLYLGLCYKTLIDGGFCDRSVTSGSVNILLLALTRGFANLYRNIAQVDHRKSYHYDKAITHTGSVWLSKYYNFLPDKNKILGCFRDPIHEPKPISKEEENRYMTEHGIVRIKPTKDTILQKKIFLGANSLGVIVKIKYPTRLMIASILFVALFLFFAVVIARGRRVTSSLYRFVDYCGTLAEVSSSMIALLLVFVKIMFRRWEFGDMLHSRRRAQTFTELSRILPSKRKQAIRLLASLENPKQIFSHHGSCAFVHEGQGEFEIDSDISVRELQEAGFTFGVNYYGEKVVADLKGNIRIVAYDSDFDMIHIEGPHLLQTKYMYRFPTKNTKVGSRNADERYRIADEV